MCWLCGTNAQFIDLSGEVGCRHRSLLCVCVCVCVFVCVCGISHKEAKYTVGSVLKHDAIATSFDKLHILIYRCFNVYIIQLGVPNITTSYAAT